MKIDEKHLDRLHSSTQAVIQKSNQERLDFLYKDKWVPYSRAVEILNELNRLLHMPKKLRMPNMLLYGETNNGKSSIVERFYRMHMRSDQEEAVHFPIISVLAPDGPDLNAFYSEILYSMMVPYASTAKTANKLEHVHYYFEKTGVRMLIVDEIHNILSGTVSRQKAFMNALKNLSNALQIPIVLVGIKDALRATSTDSQISNRFTPVYLPQWKVDEEYVNLLASLEILLPLRKPSNLASTKELALEIYNQTNGYIGEIITLVSLAAEKAIQNGTERISTYELKHCGYILNRKII